MDKFDLDTPCIVLDLDILEQNLGRMQAGAIAAGKNLRPHAKSHKCSSLAKKQLEQGAIGICAAKVSEAEVLVNSGIHGVLVTGPVASEKKAAQMPIAPFSSCFLARVEHLCDLAWGRRFLPAAVAPACIRPRFCSRMSKSSAMQGVSRSNFSILNHPQ